MKDFVKIFLILCAVVSAFFFGRNYGEETQNESTEIKTLKSENFQNRNAQIELQNLKEKFQKLLDSADLKKANEVMAQVMTIFLADLSLRLSDQQHKDFNDGRRMLCAPDPTQTVTAKEKTTKREVLSEAAVVKEAEGQTQPVVNMKRFIAAENDLLTAEDTSRIKQLLKQVEVKKVDKLLDGALMQTYAQSKRFVGTYRGSIIDVTNNIYGTLVIDIQSSNAEENLLKGDIKIFKGGVQTNHSTFESTSIAYAANNSQASLIHIDGNYLQVYKIEATQKIAGIFYDRLPNGTSKTIGTFVLSRTDFID